MGGLSLETLGAAILAALLPLLALWLTSLRTRDVSVIDVFWAPGFALTAWAACLAHPGATPRAPLLLAAVTAWALRLGLHLHARARGRGEDRRYAAMRARHGPSFAWKSLLIVFGLQGVLMLIIGLPLHAAVTANEPTELGPWDALGSLLFVLGFACEAIADQQLQTFLRAPRAEGAVMDRGLWRYSRHPNYFGDALLWWGFGCFGVAVGAPIFLLGPLIMTFFLLKVSGVSLLERDIADRRPAYREYVTRTSAFVPWPPKAPR